MALGLRYGRDFRIILGVSLVYGIAAVIAVAVGILLRHSAAAIATVMVWNLLLEGLLPVIPPIGPDIQPWLPFVAASNFLNDGQAIGVDSALEEPMPFGPWGSLAYFAAFAAVLLALALAAASRRDA